MDVEPCNGVGSLCDGELSNMLGDHEPRGGELKDEDGDSTESVDSESCDGL
jgi:hypothetical protein